MDNEKIENLLNLALNASPEERRRSPALQTGYLEEQKKWEVIVKFTGSLKEVLEKYPGVKGEELLNSDGILTVPEDEVDRIASEIQIAYMEKPKRLFFAQEPLETGGSPMAIGQNDGPYTGRGVLMAVIDSGIDYGHPDIPQSRRKYPDRPAVGPDAGKSLYKGPDRSGAGRSRFL